MLSSYLLLIMFQLPGHWTLFVSCELLLEMKDLDPMSSSYLNRIVQIASMLYAIGFKKRKALLFSQPKKL